MKSGISSEQNKKSEKEELENMISKHWRYAKIYLGVHILTLVLLVGYYVFLYNASLEKNFGLAGTLFLVPLGGLWGLFWLVVVFGVLYAISIYVKAKRKGYKKTYWPALVILFTSFWPFLVAFLVGNTAKILFGG